MLISSIFLFPGCVIPDDGYYSDPYYSPGVVVVPALPYTVNLYERPYYNHRGCYYFYNNQHWYYSRTKGGNWTPLPRTHWPSDTRWRGRHFHNNHRDQKYDRHDKRPSKDPRWNNKYRQNNDPHRKAPRHNNKYQQKKDPHYKDPRQEDSRQLQKHPMQKDKRYHKMDQRRPSPENRAMDPRQHDRNRMTPERGDRNPRIDPHHNKNRQGDKNRTEEEVRPNEPEFKRRW